MGVDSFYHLAVELQDQAQHAMRRRMLRPEIKGEIAQGRFGHGGLASVPRGQRAAAYAVPRAALSSVDDRDRDAARAGAPVKIEHCSRRPQDLSVARCNR
jgi:hypothetical protein